MPKKGEKTEMPKCPICGAFLTQTTLRDFGGQENVNYYCKKCQAAGR